MLLHEDEAMTDLGDRAYAQELLNVQTWYNQEIKRLNDTLAKKRSDAAVKYQSRAATTKTNQQPQAIPQKTTGQVDTAGNPVTQQGGTPQVESMNILKIKKLHENSHEEKLSQLYQGQRLRIIRGPHKGQFGIVDNVEFLDNGELDGDQIDVTLNGGTKCYVGLDDVQIISQSRHLREGAYDKGKIDSDELGSLKNYLDAENISFIESEDEIEFDETDVDREWIQRLPEVEEDDESILSIADGDDDDEDDFTSKDEDIDNEKVFFVKVDDENEEFIGKIYKVSNDSEWRSKLTDGVSETFEKLNFDPDWDEIDIIAFLRENYADAEIIDEPEFNDHIEESSTTHLLSTRSGKILAHNSEPFEIETVDGGDKLVATKPIRIFIERWSGANTRFEDDSNTGKIPKDRVIDPSWKGCYYVIQPGEIFSFRVSNHWDLSHFNLENGVGFKIEAGNPMSWIKRHNIKKANQNESLHEAPEALVNLQNESMKQQHRIPTLEEFSNGTDITINEGEVKVVDPSEWKTFTFKTAEQATQYCNRGIKKLESLMKADKRIDNVYLKDAVDLFYDVVLSGDEPWQKPKAIKRFLVDPFHQQIVLDTIHKWLNVDESVNEGYVDPEELGDWTITDSRGNEVPLSFLEEMFELATKYGGATYPNFRKKVLDGVDALDGTRSERNLKSWFYDKTYEG